jgi:voltage-gated potassium channel
MAGQCLADAVKRDKMNVVVVGIQHAQGHMEFNPTSDTVLRAGDHLIALGSSSTLKQLERAAR